MPLGLTNWAFLNRVKDAYGHAHGHGHVEPRCEFSAPACYSNIRSLVAGLGPCFFRTLFRKPSFFLKISLQEGNTMRPGQISP